MKCVLEEKISAIMKKHPPLLLTKYILELSLKGSCFSSILECNHSNRKVSRGVCGINERESVFGMCMCVGPGQRLNCIVHVL